MDATQWYSDFREAGETFRSQTPNETEVERCINDLKDVLDNVFTQEWARRMVDATVKLPEPWMRGLNKHLGDFDECLAVTAPNFTGRYCLLKVSNRLFGMCVPSSCGTAVIGNLIGANYSDSNDVTEYGCQARDDPTEFSAATGCLIAVLLLAVVFAITMSVCSMEERPACCSKIMSREVAYALSPLKSWRSITQPIRPRKSEGYEQIKNPVGRGGAKSLDEPATSTESLLQRKQSTPGASKDNVPVQGSAPAAAADHPLLTFAGLRAFTIAWIVVGHREALMPRLPVLDINEFPRRLKNWQHFFMIGGLFAVDTFLLIAGAVLAYTVIERQAMKNFTFRKWICFYLHRYIRLTPLFAFVILLYAGGLPYLGEGPLWPHEAVRQSTNCRTNWWSSLLYIHNYYDNRRMCVEHSWYLAVDFQLNLLAPFLLLPLTLYPAMGLFLLFLAGIASVVSPFMIVMNNNLTAVPNSIELNSNESLQQYIAHSELVYIPSHTRAAPWLMGVLLGCVLVWYPAPCARGGSVFVLWTTALLGLLGMPLVMTASAQYNDTAPAYAAALFVAFSKPMWSAALSSLVYLCAAGRARPVKAVLTWDPLGFLARTSYAVYLIHPVVQGMTGWTFRGTTVATDVVVWPMAIADFFISLVFAVPTSILYESPFIALEKILLERCKERSAKKSDSSSPSKGHTAVLKVDAPETGPSTSTASESSPVKTSTEDVEGVRRRGSKEVVSATAMSPQSPRLVLRVKTPRTLTLPDFKTDFRNFGLDFANRFKRRDRATSAPTPTTRRSSSTLPGVVSVLRQGSEEPSVFYIRETDF